jgi:anti-anti-sigma factor
MESMQDVTTVALPERLDSTSAGAAEQMLRSVVRPGARIIVDGNAVTYMSAAGVRALASALHSAETLEARLVFCRFNGAAADCLEVSGFTQLLDVADSLEAAADRLKSPAVGGSKRLHPRQAAG